ncbi:MAG TPA: hypothetical protein VH817_03800 [Thermoleophilaceae bacterium]|jgi:hypothetical protein
MPHKVEVGFDDFGWEALKREAELRGVTIEELIYHAAIYYLAGDREKLSHRPLRDLPDEPEGPGDPAV